MPRFPEPSPEELKKRFERWKEDKSWDNAMDVLGMFDDMKNDIGDSIEDIAPDWFGKPPRPPDVFKGK